MTIPQQRQAFVATPNAEKHLLDSDNLRRRQLRSALLHGSTRVWREKYRVWPAVLSGVIIIAVIVAAIAVYGAFKRQQRLAEEEKQRRQGTISVLYGQWPSS